MIFPKHVTNCRREAISRKTITRLPKYSGLKKTVVVKLVNLSFVFPFLGTRNVRNVTEV